MNNKDECSQLALILNRNTGRQWSSIRLQLSTLFVRRHFQETGNSASFETEATSCREVSRMLADRRQKKNELGIRQGP